MPKYLVSNISESKPFSSMFWLTKFNQKIDPNSRMPRIFTDSVDKSAFYIYVILRNKLAGLGKGYFIFFEKLNVITP